MSGRSFIAGYLRSQRLEARAQGQAQRRESKAALVPLRNRIQALIEEYERIVPFEHARRMVGLLHSVVKAVDVALEEAEKDQARIKKEMNPCQPSALRQRLSNLLEGF